MLSGRGRSMWLGIAIALSLCSAMPGRAQATADSERLFEAAFHREIVVGDLKGAMEQYRAILASDAKDKAVAARALFQLRQCQEKQGPRAAAYLSDRRGAAEFGDQGDTAA